MKTEIRQHSRISIDGPLNIMNLDIRDTDNFHSISVYPKCFYIDCSFKDNLLHLFIIIMNTDLNEDVEVDSTVKQHTRYRYATRGTTVWNM